MLTDRAFDATHTPTSGSDEDAYAHEEAPEGDDEDVGSGQPLPKRKPGGYDSRIEQILYENPDMQIVIADAGKSLESGGRYIVYTIRTGVC